MFELLVDGNNMLWRAYSVSPEAAPGQVSMRPAKLFLSMVAKYVERYQAAPVFFWDDEAEPIARTSLFPEYKANRNTPERNIKAAAVAQQRMFLRTILDLKFRQFVPQDGWEADDIMATFIHSARLDDHLGGSELNPYFYILSSDKDLCQLLVYDRVKLLRPKSGVECQELTRESEAPCGSWAAFGLMKALMGDPSDNINGVPGTGEVWAARHATPMKNGDPVALFWEKFNHSEAFLKTEEGQKLEKAFVNKQKALLPHRELIERNLKLVTLNKEIRPAPQAPKPTQERVDLLVQKGKVREEYDRLLRASSRFL